MPPKYKQKLRTEWLLIKDPNGDMVSEYLKRVPTNSYSVRCDWCKTEINISSAGKCAILAHAARSKHKQVADDIKKRNKGQQYFQVPEEEKVRNIFD